MKAQDCKTVFLIACLVFGRVALASQSTLLVEAVRSDDIETAKRQLQRGADPNSRLADGSPLLFLAIDRDRPLLVKLLLEHGAKIEATDHNGNDAVMRNMAAKASPAITKLLVNHGGRSGARNRDAQTAVDIGLARTGDSTLRHNAEQSLGLLEIASHRGTLKANKSAEDAARNKESRESVVHREIAIQRMELQANARGCELPERLQHVITEFNPFAASNPGSDIRRCSLAVDLNGDGRNEYIKYLPPFNQRNGRPVPNSENDRQYVSGYMYTSGMSRSAPSFMILSVSSKYPLLGFGNLPDDGSTPYLEVMPTKLGGYHELKIGGRLYRWTGDSYSSEDERVSTP